MSILRSPSALVSSPGLGVQWAACSLMERLTGKAGLALSSRIFWSIWFAMSSNSVPGLMMDLA